MSSREAEGVRLGRTIQDSDFAVALADSIEVCVNRYPVHMQVLETCLYVDDLDAAERFYTGVLGLTLHSKAPGRHLFYRLDGSMLLLFDPQASARAGDVPSHAGKAGGHACLVIGGSETDTWETRLAAHGLSVTRYRWGERGESLYFLDPAGNVLELAPPSIWGLPE